MEEEAIIHQRSEALQIQRVCRLCRLMETGFGEHLDKLDTYKNQNDANEGALIESESLTSTFQGDIEYAQRRAEIDESRDEIEEQQQSIESEKKEWSERRIQVLALSKQPHSGRFRDSRLKWVRYVCHYASSVSVAIIQRRFRKSV